MALLEIRSLSVTFGGLQALQNVNFAVERGSFTSLVGPNGAGKTTVFNALSGLVRPKSGAFFYEEERLDNLPPHQIARRGIARTFQDPRVFKELTVLDNVLSGLRLRAVSPGRAILRDSLTMREWHNAIERATAILTEFALGSRTKDRAGDLSFAEQRFLSLARALASEPRLLLLDEPTVGLDRRSIADFMSRMRQVVRHRGMTVLLVEHNMDVVLDVSDQVHLLVQGEIVASGTPAEMKRHEKMVETYLGDRYVAANP